MVSSLQTMLSEAGMKLQLELQQALRPSPGLCVRVKRETQEKGGHSLSETQHQRHEHILHVFASIHVVMECSGPRGCWTKSNTRGYACLAQLSHLRKFIPECFVRT